jgi:hypothetical protein
MRQRIADYLIEKTDLEIPERLSERQTNRSLARRMIELLRQGVPEAEVTRREDEMRAQAAQQAVKDLKLFFILEKIAEGLAIDVPEDRINAAIAQIAHESNRRFDRVRDGLSKGDGMMLLYVQLREEAALDALLEKAVVSESEGPEQTPVEPRPVARKSAERRPAERKSTAAGVSPKKKAEPAAQRRRPPGRKKGERKSDTSGSRASTAKKNVEKKVPVRKSTRKKSSP